MGIPRQGIKTASSGLPNIQQTTFNGLRKIHPQNYQLSPNYFMFPKMFGEKKKQFVSGGFKSRNCAGAVTNPKVTKMKRVYETRGPGPKRTKHTPIPQHYKCPEGNAFLIISNKRHQINVLLDSSSNLFLLNQSTAPTLKVHYEIRENPLKITAFNGEVSSTRGKYYSYPIQLVIGTNGHTTIVSCEIGDAGKYDMIIPFGCWHHEHPINNIETSEKSCFEHNKRMEHVRDEGLADMFE